MILWHQAYLVALYELVGVVMALDSLDVFHGHGVLYLLVLYRAWLCMVSQLWFRDSDHGLVEGIDAVLLVERLLLRFFCHLKVG